MQTKSVLLACAVAATLWLPLASHAEDLVEVYTRATSSDPLVREAEARKAAALEAKPQARAALLPQVRLAGSIETSTSDGASTFLQAIDDDGDPNTPPVIRNVQSDQETDSDTWQWQGELRQSLFRWDQWQTLKRSDSQVAVAEANYRASEQDLMVRVAQRYFDVLAAEDTLTSAEATLQSFARQLEQAEKRFEVGLIAVTDVQEARAAHDSATAAVIEAKRQLATRNELLRELTGEPYHTLKKPTDVLPLDQPKPADEEYWVQQALEQNLDVIAARLEVEVAKADIGIARGGYMPNVELYAQTGEFDVSADQINTNQALGTRTEGPADRDGSEDAIGVQVNVPIFTGGATSSRVRQQVALHRAARERLEGATRGAERATRDAFLGVVAERARVQALRQSVASNKTALEATEAGFEVGTRTTVDVLDARRRLFEAERDYARARYNYLINLVALRSAAGVLQSADLETINGYLTVPVNVQPTGGSRR